MFRIIQISVLLILIIKSISEDPEQPDAYAGSENGNSTDNVTLSPGTKTVVLCYKCENCSDVNDTMDHCRGHGCYSVYIREEKGVWRGCFIGPDEINVNSTKLKNDFPYLKTIYINDKYLKPRICFYKDYCNCETLSEIAPPKHKKVLRLIGGSARFAEVDCNIIIICACISILGYYARNECRMLSTIT